MEVYTCSYIYLTTTPQASASFLRLKWMYIHLSGMNNLVPAYLLPYVLGSSVAVVAALIVGLRRAPGPRVPGFRMVSALLVAWFFAALVPTWLGFYQGLSSRVPTIQYGLLIPIALGILLFWRWPALKHIVESTPQSWMVGIQVYRVLGAIFLVLYAAGRMPREFAWPAGIGDVFVGLSAPLVAVAYARQWRRSRGLLVAWNLLGIADLVVAVTTGFLTSPSPLQLLAPDNPNQLIGAFPLAMIPVFLVPLSVLLHLASLEKLRHTGQSSIPGAHDEIEHTSGFRRSLRSRIQTL
jgi:hypothetical protein